MKNRRYSGSDWHLWPFTFSKHTEGSYRPFGIIIDIGAHEDRRGGCHIRFSAFGFTLICELPPIISDYRERHVAKSWDSETIKRLGKDWYEERFPREYGFTFTNGALHTYFGAQTHSSVTTKGRVFFLPWIEMRHIRRSFFDENGKHFHTEFDSAPNSWAAIRAIEDACPKVCFEFEDFDGQTIKATTHIEEREWRHGTWVFKWLYCFRRSKVHRTLALDFSAEVGPEKGSWKGGTLGHGIEMLPGELHEDAFKRYCEQEHRSKYRRFKIRYIGVAA